MLNVAGRAAFTDTHVHFWDRGQQHLAYEWLEPGVTHPIAGDYEAIKAPRYSPMDFASETRFTGVRKIVHVQAAVGTIDPVAETRWLETCKESCDIPMTFIAHADLADPSLDAILDGHVMYGNVCGVRDLRYDDYLDNSRWRRGYARLAHYGLVFCDDPAFDQMPDAARLASSCPEVIYCVDHAGFPACRDKEYFELWRRQMSLLAKVDNTVVKVSGLGMADHEWTVASLRNWVLACIEMWGVQRVVFGSNWPCDRMYSSYADVWEAYGEILEPFSVSEQDHMLSRNADRLFKLTD